jgi:transcriptional regulator MraZ
MPSNRASGPIYYNSLYRHGVDEKRRVQIPAKWRPAEPEILTLVLWPKGIIPEACLLVLPPKEWEALVQKLKAMPFADPKAEALRRLLGKKSDRVTLDKGGRICLPEAIAKAAAIDEEVMLVGLLDRFEIWNPERYETASVVDDELLPEAFKLI